MATDHQFPIDAQFPTDMRLQRGGAGDDRLRLERHFDSPVERVWQALTDSKDMSSWFACQVEYDELAPGSTVELRFPGGEPEPGKILGYSTAGGSRSPGRRSRSASR
ncbi:MAG: SRPBCC domain-containing protein [Kineosporiaceae bacterium]